MNLFRKFGVWAGVPAELPNYLRTRGRLTATSGHSEHSVHGRPHSHPGPTAPALEDQHLVRGNSPVGK
jgi:hypothetical protein